MQGQVSLYLLFIIPVLTIAGPLGAAGALLLPAAILLLFLSLVPARPRGMELGAGDTKTRWGGVIMLGPIPIPFGSARGQWWLIPLAIGAALLLLLILLP
mgnify:CR=1 FL=1